MRRFSRGFEEVGLAHGRNGGQPDLGLLDGALFPLRGTRQPAADCSQGRTTRQNPLSAGLLIIAVLLLVAVMMAALG